MRTRDDLRIMQALPLELKVRMTQRRVWEWVKEFGEEGVYLSWSGGKDSTVLRHIIRQYFPNVVSVFVNTGLEYPEIQAFVRAAKDRGEPVEILRPEMRFDEVIKKYGYPVIGKRQANAVELARKNLAAGKYSYRLMTLGVTAREAFDMGLDLPDEEQLTRYERTATGSKFAMHKYRPLLKTDFLLSAKCCDVMKKRPAQEYERRTGKKPILATMAQESLLRENAWFKNGCNAFNAKHPTSAPMAFWTEQDVLRYIKLNGVEIASVYGEVVYKNDPEQMRWEEFTGDSLGRDELCTTGCDRTGCVYCGFGAHLQKGESRFERDKRTHPRQYEYCIGGGEYNEAGVWQPNKKGLGMGHVFDELNRIYGNGFIRY